MTVCAKSTGGFVVVLVILFLFCFSKTLFEKRVLNPKNF